MKGVLLSAGRGSRLRPITSYLPKPLLPAGEGRRIIEIALEPLLELCDEVLVVAGHLGELVERFLKRRYPSVRVERVERVTSGNLSTLLKAEEFVQGEEFLIGNADHIFGLEITQFFPQRRAPLELACQREREIYEDEMKVIVEGGKVKFMSKELEEYHGAYVGLAYVSGDVSQLFWEKARALRGNGSKVEDVFNSLAEFVEIRPIWIDGVEFYEVDTLEDYRRLVYGKARCI